MSMEGVMIESTFVAIVFTVTFISMMVFVAWEVEKRNRRDEERARGRRR